MRHTEFVSYDQMHCDVCFTMLSAGNTEDIENLSYIMERGSLSILFDHDDELRDFIRESYDRHCAANDPPFPYYDTVWRVALDTIRNWFRR